MTQRIIHYSAGHASESACAAAIATLQAQSQQPHALAIFGPFRILTVAVEGDAEADPPVAPVMTDDGFWYFNALSRGEELPGDWIAAPATPWQVWR